MEARAQLSPSAIDWKELYKAALFEDDNSKIAKCIADAEEALSARAAELFEPGANQLQERQAMENAVYFLRLLRKTELGIGASPEPAPQMDQQLD